MHHLKWSQQSGLWSTSDLQSFVSSGYESANYEPLRSRVNLGLELYLEYSINTLTDGSFSHAMENYLWGKKFLHEWTGYKHDLKPLNHNFGKKNAFKKSQMRTLLTYVVVPGILITTALMLMIFGCLMSCILNKCCKKPNNVKTSPSSS